MISNETTNITVQTKRILATIGQRRVFNHNKHLFVLKVVKRPFMTQCETI